MKKREIVKEKKDFNFIIKNSPYVKNNAYIIYIRKKEEDMPKFGITVSNKTGCAVVRNRLKRQVRSIIDGVKGDFKNKRDYIIMIRKSCVDLSFQEMREKLIELIKEIV